MADDVTWEQAKQVFPAGTVVRGTVTHHFPFGIFVVIPEAPFTGLVQITDFKDDGRMTPEQFPAIGAPVEAVVLGFKDHGKQIWLGMRPSQLSRGKWRTPGAYS